MDFLFSFFLLFPVIFLSPFPFVSFLISSVSHYFHLLVFLVFILFFPIYFIYFYPFSYFLTLPVLHTPFYLFILYSSSIIFHLNIVVHITSPLISSLYTYISSAFPPLQGSSTLDIMDMQRNLSFSSPFCACPACHGHELIHPLCLRVYLTAGSPGKHTGDTKHLFMISQTRTPLFSRGNWRYPS